MKWMILPAIFTAFVAVVSSQLCGSEEDCNEGFCCVVVTESQRRGLCLTLTRENWRCNEPESKIDDRGGKYLRYCPCAEGLVCEPNKPGITDPNERREALRCQEPTETSTGPNVTAASNAKLPS